MNCFGTRVSVEQRSRESQSRCSGSAFHSHLLVPISEGLTWTTPKCELATEDPCSMHLMRAPPYHCNVPAMGLAGRWRHLRVIAVLVSMQGWTLFTIRQTWLHLYWGQDFIHRAWTFRRSQIQRLTNTHSSPHSSNTDVDARPFYYFIRLPEGLILWSLLSTNLISVSLLTVFWQLSLTSSRSKMFRIPLLFRQWVIPENRQSLSVAFGQKNTDNGTLRSLLQGTRRTRY